MSGRVVGLVVGGLMVALGLLFTFQGLGYIGGSVMTGSSFWAVAGPLIAGLGTALLITSAKR